MAGKEKYGSSVPEKSSSLHVMMFPWFAFGHISPFAQLANKIAAHGVKVSFLAAPGNISRIRPLLQPHHDDQQICIDLVPVQIPAVDGLPPGLESTAEMSRSMTDLLKLAVDKMGPQMESLLAHLHPDIVVFDFCMQWVPFIAHKLGIKSVFFSTFNALTCAYVAVPSRLIDGGRPPGIEDLKRPPAGLIITSTTLPTSFKTFEARDFLNVYKTSGGPSVFDRVSACVHACDAVVMRTCSEMEGPYVEYIETQYKKPVLLAGPVVPDPPSGELDRPWSEWLDRFPERSVILCSFGTEAFLEADRIRELAGGLEMTGSPFVLVLNFLEDQWESGRHLIREAALPEGFEERVKERGMVHSGWMPQQLILAHRSVGYFVTHAGLSSITEGLVNDVQLVLLPHKGDQFLNTKLVACDLKAGVEVKRNDEDGFFTKEDVCEAVKTAMASDQRGSEWRDFLRNKDTQETFSRHLVEEMKEMVIMC